MGGGGGSRGRDKGTWQCVCGCVLRLCVCQCVCLYVSFALLQGDFHYLYGQKKKKVLCLEVAVLVDWE